MMGHTHALAGAVAWLGVVPFLADYGMKMTPGEIIAGSVVCAGAALLPDIDHHDGSIANALGPLTRLLCKFMEWASGGHRHATHSLMFVLVTMFGTDLLAQYFRPGWWVELFLLICLGLRGVGIHVPEREHFNMIINGAAALGITYLMIGMHFAGPGLDLFMGHYYLGWAGLSVGLGTFMHLFTDCMTPRGCPLFWPVKKRFEVPIVPRTDGLVEKWVMTPLLTLGVVILAIRTSAGGFAVHWLQHNRG